MRNRAKCKLCKEIIESYTMYDHISCKCGEIAVWGGKYELNCQSNNWANFLRVDDEGNEIIVKVKDKDTDIPSSKPTRKELIEMLDEMIKSIENLPSHAMAEAINHYDHASLMILLSSLFKSFDDSR